MLSNYCRQALALGCCISIACYGQEGVKSDGSQREASLALGRTYFSNVFQDPEELAVSDTSTDYLADIRYDKASFFSEMLLDYQYVARDYQSVSFGRNEAIIGQAEIWLGATSSPLRWVIANQEQTLSNTAVVRNTLEELGQRSVYSTGPDIHFRASSVDTLKLSARYDIVNISDGDTDSERQSIQLEWLHRLNAFSSVHLIGSTAKIDAKNIEGITYDQNNIALAFQRFSRHFTFDSQIGLTTVANFAQANDEQKLTYNISIANIFNSSRFVLTSNSQLVDSSVGNNLDFSNFRNDEFDLSNEDFVIQKQVRNSALWSIQLLQRLRSELSFSQITTTDVDDSNQEENIDRLALSSFYQAKPFLRFEFGASYRESEDINLLAARSQKVRTQNIGFSYFLGRSITTRCRLETIESQGDINYEDEQIGCSLNYTIF